jgi:hypothetical protein
MYRPIYPTYKVISYYFLILNHIMARHRWRLLPPDTKGNYNILNKQLAISDKGWSSSLDVGWGLTASRRKNPACYKMLQGTLDLAGCNEASGSIKDGQFLD